MQIFRKRSNTWWKVAPSITLSSLSGIFANANLSILFSSHVDIFQLEKSLSLQNHQLLIPKDDRPIRPNKNSRSSAVKTSIDLELPNLNTLNLNPNAILTVDSNFIKSIDPQTGSAVLSKRESSKDVPQVKSAKHLLAVEMGANTIDQKTVDKLLEPPILSESIKTKRSAKSATKNGVRTIGDLGYFPTTMNILERCPNNHDRLCLNMLDDRVPAYSIKVKMPFRENSVMHHHLFKVKIARIMTDATTKDALQVSVEVINEGLEAHEFSICVCNCPLACDSAAKTTVKKILLPHIGETVNFLLPLVMENNKKHKFHCDAIVKAVIPNTTAEIAHTPCPSNKQCNTTIVKRSFSPSRKKEKVVAIRQLTVETDNRCLCIWECSCHCMPRLETYEEYHACQMITYSEEKQAGLLLRCQLGEAIEDVCLGDNDDEENEYEEETEEESSGFCTFLMNAIILIIIMVILGLLKATIGRFWCSKTDKCGYDYVQPGGEYENATRCRRFFVNTFFFIVFPFLFWCKCFTPSEEDLLVASTEWQCSVAKQSLKSQSDSEGKMSDFDECDEDDILTQKIDRHCDSSSCKTGGRLAGGQDVFDLDSRLSDLNLAIHDGTFDDEDDEDEEENTKFVLQALIDSRESLKTLLKNNSNHEINLEEQEDNQKLKEANELIKALKAARIVYRTFDHSVGNVRNIPSGVKYCIQGYFLPSLGAEYEFVNYNPLAQYRCIAANGTSLEELRPPIMLFPKEFSRVYKSKLKVLEAEDLSVQPPPNVPCINISTLAAVASSVAKLAMEQDYSTNSFPAPVSIETEQQTSIQPLPSQEFNLHINKEEILENKVMTQEANNGFLIDLECLQQLDDESLNTVSEQDYDSENIEILTHSFDTIEE